MLSKKGGLTRLSSIAAMLGISVGVASLIAVQSIYNGFRSGFEEKVLRQTSHITIIAETGTVAAGNIVEEAIRQNINVREIEPVLFRSSVVNREGKSAYGLIKVLLEDSKGGTGVGTELARKLGVGKGDRLNILMAGDAGEPIAGEFEVTEIVSTGIYEYDSSLVLISPKEFAKAISPEPLVPNAYLLKIDTPFAADAVSAKLRDRLGPGFAVVDWISANRPFFSALALERKIAAAVVLLMICVSALGISATMVLLANERRFDLAVLKTCGAKSRSLALMFLTEGSAIGLLGVVAGTLLGLGACAVANRTGFVTLSPTVYSVSSLELIPDVWSSIWIATGAFALSIIAILVPVLRVSRVPPAEIFRSL